LEEEKNEEPDVSDKDSEAEDEIDLDNLPGDVTAKF
jgi:hypothetical protein